MYPPSRFKLIPVISLLLIFVVGLALFSSTRLATHAAGTHVKVSTKSGMISTTSTSSCGAWNVISSPNVGTSSNTLYAVATISANNVWAVGDYSNNTAPGPLQTLIEHWNGTNWSVIPSPNVGTSHNVLNGVASVSANNIWAVGYSLNNGQQTLIEHWDGKNWSVISSPNVGTNTNVLNAVTKVPASNELWAVGYYNDTGSTYQPLIEHWNGTNWTVVPNPNLGTIDNFLNGVTAISANNIWAVGSSNNSSAGVERTLIEYWNGTSWSVVPSPNQGSNGYLHAVVRVPGSSKLWAVGAYNNTNTSYETLTEYWNGKNWSIVSSPNIGPEGSTSVNILLGVTAISKTNVWAVGLYQSSNGMSATQPLIEHWNGTSWSIVSSPNPGSGSALNDVTRVPNSSQLWAVGGTAISGVGSQSFIESYC